LIRDRVPQVFELALEAREVRVAHRFEAEERVSRVLVRPNELVELEVHGVRIAVLRILNEKHHQERDDRSPRVDDELPRVRVVKHRARETPHDDHGGRDEEGLRATDHLGGGVRESSKPHVHHRRCALFESVVENVVQERRVSIDEP
jgi:hypothetical protein